MHAGLVKAPSGLCLVSASAAAATHRCFVVERRLLAAVPLSCLPDLAARMLWQGLRRRM